MRRQFIIVIIATGAVALGACGRGDDDDELPPISWEGEHLRYGSDDPDISLCAGTLPALDEYTGALKVEFGAPADWVVDYYVIKDKSAGYWSCFDTSVKGCSKGSTVLTTEQAHEHEVVHAVHEALNPTAHRFLTEGLAESFSLHTYTHLPAISIQEILDVLDETGEMDQPSYVRAGHFWSWMVDEYGLDAVVALGNKTSLEDSSTSSLEVAFTAVLDEDLLGVIERYEAESVQCEYQKHRNNLLACQSPDIVLEPDPEVWLYSSNATLDWSASCDDPETIGPRLGQQWRHWTIDIPAGDVTDTVMMLWVDVGADELPEGWGWHLMSCAECEGEVDLWRDFTVVGEVAVITDFPPGRYILSAYVDAGESRPLPGRIHVEGS